MEDIQYVLKDQVNICDLKLYLKNAFHAKKSETTIK